MTPNEQFPGPPTLTLLGTGTSMGVPMIGCDCPVCTSSDPRNQRTRTGVFVQNGPQGFLIDTSQELRLQLVRARIQAIDAVVYTHAHADHILGLDDLRIFGFKQRQPVPLYCEADVEMTLRRTFPYAFDERVESLHSRPRLVFQRIDLAPFELSGLTVRPVRLLHGTLPVLGFRIGDVAFCTDVSEIPRESLPQLEGLETLILGAIRDEPHPTHFSVAQALEVMDRLQPRRMYLTHISHSLDYAATNARLPHGVELAYDGLVISLRRRSDLPPGNI